ncbi:MAG: hypothetical protein J5875_13380 [Paludibacteraceae bacterium]|nr:hypothetical protein [Paludibacteraceae bacterium]
MNTLPKNYGLRDITLRGPELTQGSLVASSRRSSLLRLSGHGETTASFHHTRLRIYRLPDGKSTITRKMTLRCSKLNPFGRELLNNRGRQDAHRHKSSIPASGRRYLDNRGCRSLEDEGAPGPQALYLRLEDATYWTRRKTQQEHASDPH